MSSFNVLLILAISALTSAYPVRNPYPEYIGPPIPYTNYQILVNRPYPAPNTLSIEGPEADQFVSYVDSTPFEQLAPPAPQLSKAHSSSHQTEEVHAVVEDVLKLLIDQRLCEISNANNAPIAKRSVDQRFAVRATPTSEPSSFTQQQLAFLKELRPEDIKQLIKLLIPAAPALVANRTVPIQQEPEPTTFYMPTPLWQSTPLQALPPTPYGQSRLLPFHSFQHPLIYEPFGPADEAQVHLIKPYVESPVAPSVVLNKMPPISSPFVYSVHISAPLHNYQAPTRPLTAPNNQMVFKPPTVNLPTKEEVVTSKPQALEKLHSIFSESRILLDKDTTTKGQVTSTEKIQDLGTSPSKVEDASNVTVGKLDGEAVKRTAKSAASGEVGARVAENEQLLEVFKAIREDLIKDSPCRVLTPKRRAINERPDGDFVRKQMYQNYLNRHAIPPATLPGRRHSPPAKLLYHKYTRHTPMHSSNW